VLFLEISPAILEWLGWKRVRSWSMRLTVVLTVSGMVLSTLHQSSLGSLFLIVPGRLHPLWYSPFLPVFFFVSAVAAGLAMVIVEGALSHSFFHDRIAPALRESFDSLTLGLGKAAAVVLFAYFGIKVVGVAADHHWSLLTTPYGLLFLVEVLGFVGLPCALFTWGYRYQRVRAVRVAAVLTVVGIVLNRLNVAVIALGWRADPVYTPSFAEVATSVVIVVSGCPSSTSTWRSSGSTDIHPEAEQGVGDAIAPGAYGAGGRDLLSGQHRVRSQLHRVLAIPDRSRGARDRTGPLPRRGPGHGPGLCPPG
jgi:Ni/Fe-hydrogenase subunit HybB-like protein